MKIWKTTDNEDQYTDATVIDMSLLYPFKLTMSEKFGSDFPLIELLIESDGTPSDYIKSGPLFIASQKLMDILERFDVSMEVFPVVIYQNNMPVKDRYFYIHLLQEVDCIDRFKSDFTLDGNYIDEIDRLVIDKTQLDDINLLKIANCIDSIIIASNDLVDEILGSEVTGIKFLDLEGWNS